ncbi:unnamed protein product, partial [Sphenostylis stenocarpa]
IYIWSHSYRRHASAATVATLRSPYHVAAAIIQRRRRRERKRQEIKDWELEYWPHRMVYEEIEETIKGFYEDNMIGVGGNGKIYMGVLRGGVAIAMKHISHENDCVLEFLAEVSSLGRLKQRNLVGLRGWCKKDVLNIQGYDA